MKAPGGKFGRKKEAAIAALLTQRNIDEAARSVGIGANTLLRWLKVPEFQAAYREARRAAFGQSIARLQQGTSAATTTLLKTMIDPNTPASVKVRAAEAILTHAAKSIEIEDIEARVAALEASVAADRGTGRR
jgi:transposase-like protein